MKKLDNLDLVAMQVAKKAASRYYYSTPVAVRCTYSREDLEQEFMVRYLTQKLKIKSRRTTNESGYIWTMYRNCFLRILETHNRHYAILERNFVLSHPSSFCIFANYTEEYNGG